MKRPNKKIEPGTMVGLAWDVTRRGYPHEEQIGLVIEVVVEGGQARAVVNFAGEVLSYPLTYLRVIDASG